MKLVVIYKCLVCSKAHYTQKDAITCQTKHLPFKEEWFTCEICGKGWRNGSVNPSWAVNGAEKCEKSHEKLDNQEAQ